MSVYQVGKLVFDLNRLPRLVEDFQRDPEPFLDRYRLSEDEKKAIHNKDVRYFYELGVNPYSVMGLARLLKMQQTEYLAAIANAAPHPALTSVFFPGPPKKGEYLLRAE